MITTARYCLLFSIWLTASALAEDGGRTILRSEPDYLCREIGNVNESSSLVEVRSHEKTLLSLRQESSGKYYLQAQRLDWAKTTSLNDKQYKEVRLEVSEELAKHMIHLWLHELQRIPDGEELWLGLDGMTWFFTARLSEKRWAHGRIWSPRREAPPLWMVKVSMSLIDHAFDPSESDHLKEYREYAGKILRYGRASNSEPQQGAAPNP